MRRLIVALCAAFVLSGCGGTLIDEQQNEYMDKCIIEAGPQPERSNVTNYCYAKWRQSQREK